jgi:glycosyltransferase involved in cell wall biosynthesis
MKNKISIFIPTYNRSEKLKRSLNLIQKFNNFDIPVFVLDNDSTDNTGEIVKDINSELNCNIFYRKNIVNIGMTANVIRCFEMCETEWIWVLGDDDSIVESSFNTISSYIENDNNENTCFINFYSDSIQLRNQDLYSIGLEDFASKMDNFSLVLFISTSIFNVKKIKPYLSFSYNYSYSLAPHLISTFIALREKNYVTIFSKEKIVTYQPVSDKSQKWSYFNLFLGVTTLFEIFEKIDDKIMLPFSKKITSHLRINKILFHYVMMYYHENSFMRKYVFNQIVFRNLQYLPNKSLRFYLKVSIWLLIINSDFLTALYFKYNTINLDEIDIDLNIQPLNNRIC